MTTAQAHVQREARQKLRTMAVQLDDALGQDCDSLVLKLAAELQEALARAEHAAVEERALLPYRRRLEALAQKGAECSGDAFPSGSLAPGRDNSTSFPSEVTVSLLSGRSVHFQVTSRQSVRSLREAVAVHFGIAPYRLALMAGSRELVDNNASLLACNLPSNGLLAIISQKDLQKDAHYCVFEQPANFKNFHGSKVIEDALRTELACAMNRHEDGEPCSDAEHRAVAEVAGRLRGIAGLLTKEHGHSQQLAKDLRRWA